MLYYNPCAMNQFYFSPFFFLPLAVYVLYYLYKSGWENMKKSQRYSNSNATKEYLSVVKPGLCFSLVLIEDPRRLQGYI